jgi:rhodanese-related sulfurtransferase
VSPEELAARLSQVQVVDVRYPNEWEAGRIQGALHVVADELAERLGSLDRDRPVVTVCRSGQRSAAAARMLVEEGFDAQNLDGGLDAWVAAGLPLATPSGEPGTVVDPAPPPDDRPDHFKRLESEFLSVLFDVQEHFGDDEPSDEELRTFLRDRLIGQGRSPEEADEFMEKMDHDA